jgi:hypothetical protein
VTYAQVTTVTRYPSQPRLRRRRRVLIVVTVLLAGFATWRVFPRFDSRFLGEWHVVDGQLEDETITFYSRGNCGRTSTHDNRKRRWWVAGNKLVIHNAHPGRWANIQVIANYSIRTLLFIGPPADVTEFDIARIDAWSATLQRRPRLGATAVTETLALRR